MRGAAVVATLGGCALVPRAVPVPMRTLEEPAACPAGSGGAGPRVLMLPGAYSPPEEFLTEGFVAALRRRGVPAAVTLADSHLGYFVEGQSVRRLSADVIGPARAAGAPPLWLVGISLGGFIGLHVAALHPQDVAGLVLLAPYPGRESFLEDAEAAGGIEAWSARNPVRIGNPANEWEPEVWTWLVERKRRAAAGERVLPVFLGYGLQDRFAQHLGWMATLLAPEDTLAVPGGHDWKTWRRLWDAWLDRDAGRSALPRVC